MNTYEKMDFILYSKWTQWDMSNQDFFLSFQSKEKPNQNHYIFNMLANRNFPFIPSKAQIQPVALLLKLLQRRQDYWIQR